jgi:hypothetical protein
MGRERLSAPGDARDGDDGGDEWFLSGKPARS